MSHVSSGYYSADGKIGRDKLVFFDVMFVGKAFVSWFSSFSFPEHKSLSSLSDIIIIWVWVSERPVLNQICLRDGFELIVKRCNRRIMTQNGTLT